MQRFLLLAATVAVVLGGRSPNADFLDEIVGKNPGARYSNNILEDASLDVPGLVAKYGYPIEVHQVTTEDGYILTAHRIPHGRHNNSSGSRKPVVFLMHGLMSSSAGFLVLGPGNALGYLLAEEGYDVWLGNARGNFYSRRHQHLNPNSLLSQSFWRFSWDEIGNLDLPAFLAHIERVTGQSKLHYIGHSQGGTSFLVLNSLRPENNEKFISFQGLAPASFFRYNEHSVFSSLAPMGNIIESAAFALGRGEIMRNREFTTWFASRYCYEGSIFSSLCSSMLISGMSDYFNQTMIPVFLGHSPAGCSIRQFAHYGQSINGDTFRRYDHGSLQNIRQYGSRTPPDYDVKKITAPTYLHYSLNDALVHWRDVERLAGYLPNLAGLHKVDSPVFDHLDFIWGNGVKWRLYDRVISLMKEAERKAYI